jgi:hypothetical protein
MFGKWKVSLALAVAAVFGMVMVAQAQPLEDVKNERRELRKQERQLRKQERKLRKEEMREKIEMVIMWKLTEELDLDQETANKLFPILNESNKQQRELRQKRGDTMKQIKEELKREFPEAATLRTLIAEFKQNERDMVEARIKRLDDLSKILSEEQIAKLIALVPKIERSVRDAIHEGRRMYRERRRDRGDWGGQGPGPGMGQGPRR